METVATQELTAIISKLAEENSLDTRDVWIEFSISKGQPQWTVVVFTDHGKTKGKADTLPRAVDEVRRAVSLARTAPRVVW